jgi:hypothetical protein
MALIRHPLIIAPIGTQQQGLLTESLRQKTDSAFWESQN